MIVNPPELDVSVIQNELAGNSEPNQIALDDFSTIDETAVSLMILYVECKKAIVIQYQKKEQSLAKCCTSYTNCSKWIKLIKLFVKCRESLKEPQPKFDYDTILNSYKAILISSLLTKWNTKFQQYKNHLTRNFLSGFRCYTERYADDIKDIWYIVTSDVDFLESKSVLDKAMENSQYIKERCEYNEEQDKLLISSWQEQDVMAPLHDIDMLDVETIFAAIEKLRDHCEASLKMWTGEIERKIRQTDDLAAAFYLAREYYTIEQHNRLIGIICRHIAHIQYLGKQKGWENKNLLNPDTLPSFALLIDAMTTFLTYSIPDLGNTDIQFIINSVRAKLNPKIRRNITDWEYMLLRAEERDKLILSNNILIHLKNIRSSLGLVGPNVAS